MLPSHKSALLFQNNFFWLFIFVKSLHLSLCWVPVSSSLIHLVIKVTLPNYKLQWNKSRKGLCGKLPPTCEEGHKSVCGSDAPCFWNVSAQLPGLWPHHNVFVLQTLQVLLGLWVCLSLKGNINFLGRGHLSNSLGNPTGMAWNLGKLWVTVEVHYRRQ